MTAHCLRITGRLLLILLAVSVPHSSVSGQTVPPSAGQASQGQFGFHLFQLLLEHEGLRSITEFETAVRDDPWRTVVVLAGNLDWMTDRDWQRVREFVTRGGAVLVASDRSTECPRLFRIRSGPVEVEHDRHAYQGFTDCPSLQNDQDDRLLEQHDLTNNVSKIVGNRSGWISQARGNLGSWHPVAHLPEFRRGNQEFFSAPLIGALETDNFNPGKIVVAADHSLFVNGMLWHGGNAMLAINTVDWLCRNARRTKLYFSVDGTASRSGIPIPPVTPPIPENLPENLPDDIPPISLEDLANTPPESLITFTNSLLTRFEDDNVFNRLLANHAADLPLFEYRRQLYLTVAVIAGFWLIRQLLRRGRRLEPPVSRNVVSAAESRMQDMVTSNDLQRPLRELAQDLFRTLTGSDDPKDWSVWPQTTGVPGLRRLEKIATNVDRRPISQREFRRLVRKIERIRTMHEQGQLMNPRPSISPTWETLKQRLRPAT